MANSPTLTHQMLDDLHKGNAAISLLPYNSSGVNLAGLSFASADQIFTEQDSFTLAPSDPDNLYRVDQYDELIDFDEGDWVINGNIPSFATAVFDYLFEAGSAISGSSSRITGQDGTTKYEGKGYNGAKVVDATVLVESKSKKTAIVFGHVQFIVNNPAIDDHQKPGYVKIAGYILDNPGGDKFAVLKKYVAA
ncbi:MAG: hypothetical protein IKS71_00860 [Bacteroidales bacterium]|nr:hypothetical protein [Bacteroidales bacterium]